MHAFVSPQTFGPQQTATKSFQDWFAGSKVVARGKPKLAFHRTCADFDAFDTTRGDLGSHFGSTDQARGMLGGTARPGERTIPVYLSLKNPIRLLDQGSFHADSVAPQLRRRGLIDAATAIRLTALGDRGTALERRAANQEIKDILTRLGFDGVVYRNLTEGKGDSYIAFDPTQIKSALANNGDFDPTNPDATK